MIRILTKKEYDFLKEFSSLIEKYDVLFQADKQGRVSIQLYDGHDLNTNWEQIAIHFQDNFDESDINDLLAEITNQLKELVEQHQSIIKSPIISKT